MAAFEHVPRLENGAQRGQEPRRETHNILYHRGQDFAAADDAAGAGSLLACVMLAAGRLPCHKQRIEPRAVAALYIACLAGNDIAPTPAGSCSPSLI